MIDTTENSSAALRVSYRTKDELLKAREAVVKWWVDLEHPGLPLPHLKLFPLYVNRHELSEILTTLERQSVERSFVLKRPVYETLEVRRSPYPQPPWNARTNGRLKAFVVRHVNWVRQPVIGIPTVSHADFPSGANAGSIRAGREGLEYLWKLMEGAERIPGQIRYGILFLDHEHVWRNEAQVKPKSGQRELGQSPTLPTRTALETALDELEHVIKLSIERKDQKSRLRPGRALQDEGASAWAVKALFDLTTKLRPRLISSLKEDDSGWKPRSDKRDRLVCIVARGEPGASDVAIVFAAMLPGYFEYARQRMVSLLHNSFWKRKSQKNVAESEIPAAVVQVSWIRRALNESGDCAAERALFGQALTAAMQGQDVTEEWEKKTVFALLCVDADALTTLAGLRAGMVDDIATNAMAALLAGPPGAAFRRWATVVLRTWAEMDSAGPGRANRRLKALAVHERLKREGWSGLIPAQARSLHRDARATRELSKK